jgi:intracellular sulfur oxidation DsrE/DsrF family protein
MSTAHAGARLFWGNGMTLWRREVLGLGLAATAAGSSGASAAGTPEGPAMEAQDAWLDLGGHRHRMVFDTTNTDGLGEALGYARNFYTVNDKAYGIAAGELSVVIILRHISTTFGFNDAIWAKYGGIFADRVKLNDPRTKAPALVNLFNTGLKDESLPNGGVTIAELAKLGARFAVCASASHGAASLIAKKMGGDADTVFKELTANLVPNALMVPAGIVALNRAQEHGYTLSSCS